MQILKPINVLLLALSFTGCPGMIKNESISGEPNKLVSMDEIAESIVQRLRANPELLFIKPRSDQDPLIHTLLIKEDYAPLLANLLNRKALNKDSEIQVASDKYPLIIFALAQQARANVKNMENIRVLLAAEPDLNISSVNPNAVLSNCTPLSLAIENEKPEAVAQILQAYEAHERKFRLPGVFNKGIVNASCAGVRLPLMQTVDRVCMSNQKKVLLKIAEILLQYNADPHAKDAYGARLGNANITYKVDTPYELAEGRAYQDFVDLFEGFMHQPRTSH